MKPNDYVSESGATDLQDYSSIKERLSNDKNAKLFHYLIGMGTEVGELQDQLKKHIMYGRKLDDVNLLEEMGDVLWYMARALELLGSDFEQIMELNNAKLKMRFGEKFTEHAALNRNVIEERKILEGN